MKIGSLEWIKRRRAIRAERRLARLWSDDAVVGLILGEALRALENPYYLPRLVWGDESISVH